MQIGGGTAGGGDYVSSFFSQYLTLFADKTGSIINKHVLGSTQEGVRPNGGGYDPNPWCRDVTPPVTAQ